MSPSLSVAAVVASLLICASAAGADAALTAPGAWTPETIAWQRTDPNGAKYAVLDGVRDRTGVPFTYAFLMPAGAWVGVHSHSSDARVFVARGVLRLGFGDRADPAEARAYPAGSYVTVPAGVLHFEGADVETLIYGVALGPWSTTYQVSAPATPSRRR